MTDMSPLSPKGATTRTVALAGATGLVGRAILEGLLADDSVAAVHALGRREPGVPHPKLTPHMVNFNALPPQPPLQVPRLRAGRQVAVPTVEPRASLRTSGAGLSNLPSATRPSIATSGEISEREACSTPICEGHVNRGASARAAMTAGENWPISVRSRSDR